MDRLAHLDELALVRERVGRGPVVGVVVRLRERVVVLPRHRPGPDEDLRGGRIHRVRLPPEHPHLVVHGGSPELAREVGRRRVDRERHRNRGRGGRYREGGGERDEAGRNRSGGSGAGSGDRRDGPGEDHEEPDRDREPPGDPGSSSGDRHRPCPSASTAVWRFPRALPKRGSHHRPDRRCLGFSALATKEARIDGSSATEIARPGASVGGRLRASSGRRRRVAPSRSRCRARPIGPSSTGARESL